MILVNKVLEPHISKHFCTMADFDTNAMHMVMYAYICLSCCLVLSRHGLLS